MTLKKLLPTLLLLCFLFMESTQACIVNPTHCPPNAYNASTALDFTATTFQYYSKTNPSTNPQTIQSPYFTDAGSVNQNISNFSIPSSKDFLEADGWRYIKHDFGTPSKNIDHPWFVIYNYYSGILRVFLAVDNLPNDNGEAMITLEWETNSQTALLDHYTGNEFSHAVNDFQNNSKAKLANYFANSRPYWLHADFTMAYDPCSCDTPGRLLIKAALLENTSLNFTIEGNLIQELDNHGRSSQSGGLDLKTAQKGLSGAFKDGQKGIKTLKDNDVFKNLSGTSPKIADIFNLFGGVGSIVSGAVKLISLFTGSASSQPANTTPISFRADLVANGTLTTENTYEDIIFANPGGDNSSFSAPFIPHDDNIMGIFNLLTAPQVRASYFIDHNVNGLTQRVKFSIDTPIEYVLNPRLGINLSSTDTRIMVAYDYMTKLSNGQPGQLFTTDAYDISCFQDFKPAFYYNISNTGTLIDMSSIKIKIIARFRTGIGNREVVYVARFKPDIITDNSASPSTIFFSDYPDENCSGFYYPAQAGRISEVCTSTRYTSRTQFQANGDTRENNEEADEFVIEEEATAALTVYPNPNSGSFTLRYTMPGTEPGRIHISVMDLQGRVLATVLDEVAHYPGTYEVGYNLREKAAPGTYLIVQQTADGTVTKRVVVRE